MGTGLQSGIKLLQGPPLSVAREEFLRTEWVCNIDPVQLRFVGDGMRHQCWSDSGSKHQYTVAHYRFSHRILESHLADVLRNVIVAMPIWKSSGSIASETAGVSRSTLLVSGAVCFGGRANAAYVMSTNYLILRDIGPSMCKLGHVATELAHADWAD